MKQLTNLQIEKLLENYILNLKTKIYTTIPKPINKKNKLAGIVVILIIIFSNILICPFSLAITNEENIQAEEKLFQIKANLVIDKLAEEKVVPIKGDIEKYIFPAVIGHLAKNKNDIWAKNQLEILTNKLEANFYTNRDAFASPGITRILYLYSNNPIIKQATKNYLVYINPQKSTKKNYNFWTTGGTENFVNMLNTSRYLLASLGVNQGKKIFLDKKLKAEKWLNYQARKIYEVGTAEWDSSSYTAYNLIGWLNIYDFTEDPKIKKIAQAVLDYYSATMALKYSHGIYGGAEQRGGGANSSFSSITDYINWLWFSTYIPESKNFFQWPSYLPVVYPATSTYRPPIEAIMLARKKDNYDEYYRNAKANYDVKKVENPEFFYIGNSYTLGSVISTSGEQLVNWKLVSFGDSSDKNSQIVTGGNSCYKSEFNGVGKTIFDTYFQDKNILFQLTYIPSGINNKIHRQNLRNWIKSILEAIKCGNSCQFILQNKLNALISPEIYPLSDKDKNPISNYLSFPDEIILDNHEDRIYFTEINNTYLAIYPISQNTIISLNKDKNNSRLILKNQQKLGKVTGFIIEVGEKINYPNFNHFKDQIINTTEIDKSKISQGIVEYLTSDNRKIKIKYIADNFLPNVWINNEFLKLEPRLYKIYEGESLKMSNYILTLKSKTSTYEINYQGNIPKFNRKLNNS